MKLNLSKKIMGLVLIPSILICAVTGILGSIMFRESIVGEIEEQLSITASIFADELVGLDAEDMEREIQKFKSQHGIDITVFEGDTRIISTIPGAIGTKMDSKIFSDIQSGSDFFATDASVNGSLYFGYYVPIVFDGKYTSAIFAGLPQDDANAIIKTNIIKLVGCIILFGVVASIIAFLMVRKIIKNISSLESVVGRLLNNDLSIQNEKHKVIRDEIDSLYNNTIDFSGRLKETVLKIKVAANTLKESASELNQAAEFTSNNAGEISKAVEDVASGAVAQAEETTDATSRISTMSETLNSIKENTDSLHDISVDMNTSKTKAAETLLELKEANSIMSDDINSTKERVDTARESIERISKALDMIEDITEQTKLLSLNASIEAAHAGDNGRGFAVVAEEIGKLANQSSLSAKEISDIISDIVHDFKNIVEAVKNTSDNMIQQNEKLEKTQEEFVTLEQGITGTVQRIEQINTMVSEIGNEMSKVVDIVSDLSAVSEENSASTQETTASVQELNATINQISEKSASVDGEAEMLLNEISVFKTDAEM